MKTRWIGLLALSAFFLALNVLMAAEPDYPTKPIEIIIGYAPGAGTDLGARMIVRFSGH